MKNVISCNVLQYKPQFYNLYHRFVCKIYLLIQQVGITVLWKSKETVDFYTPENGWRFYLKKISRCLVCCYFPTSMGVLNVYLKYFLLQNIWAFLITWYHAIFHRASSASTLNFQYRIYWISVGTTLHISLFMWHWFMLGILQAGRGGMIFAWGKAYWGKGEEGGHEKIYEWLVKLTMWLLVVSILVVFCCC